MVGLTLDNIVKEYLFETGDTQLNKYARFYQLALSGLREFNMNNSGVIKTVQLPIKVNDTCDLPLDYLQYSKIGMIGSNGQINSLGKNDNLSLVRHFDDCGGPIASQATIHSQTRGADSDSNAAWGGDLGGTVRNSEFMGRMFGVNGGTNSLGEFRIDREHAMIVLSGIISAGFPESTAADNGQISATSIVMEYLGDISMVDGDFEVHPFMIDSLKDWMYWKSIQKSTNTGRGKVADARSDYFKSSRWAKKRFTSNTIDEWLAGFRSGNTASVKF